VGGWGGWSVWLDGWEWVVLMIVFVWGLCLSGVRGKLGGCFDRANWGLGFDCSEFVFKRFGFCCWIVFGRFGGERAMERKIPSAAGRKFKKKNEINRPTPIYSNLRRESILS